MLERAYELDSTNARIIADLAYAYAEEGRGYILLKTEENENYIKNSISLFKKASELEPDYGFIYGQWAEALYYYRRYEQAWEKVNIARNLKEVGRPNVHPRFLKRLERKMADPNKTN